MCRVTTGTGCQKGVCAQKRKGSVRRVLLPGRRLGQRPVVPRGRRPGRGESQVGGDARGAPRLERGVRVELRSSPGLGVPVGSLSYL